MASTTEATTAQLEACSISKNRSFPVAFFSDDLLLLDSARVFTSEKHGSDERGDGSESSPFKTPLQVLRHHGDVAFANDAMTIFVDSKDESKVGGVQRTTACDDGRSQGRWEPLSKAQLKKIRSQYEEEQRKQERSNLQEVCQSIAIASASRRLFQQADARRRAENLEEAKSITISEDASLPQPLVVRSLVHSTCIRSSRSI